MAKIGLLVQNDGKWQGKQIVSKKWIQESIKSRIRVDDIFSYGYHWWQIRYNIGERDYNAVLANGYGGQFIVILKKLDLVVVLTGSNYDSDQNAFLSLMLVKNFIIPAVL